MDNGEKKLITIKNVLRVLSVICLVLVFCPAFLVSCSGETVNVSAMTAVGGVSMYGEKVVDPSPIMLLCLFIPIAILVLLFIKNIADKTNAAIIAACGVVDLIMWFVFRSKVKEIAEEALCDFKSTGWFVLNIISLVLIILLTAIVMISKLHMDSDLIAAVSGKGDRAT